MQTSRLLQIRRFQPSDRDAVWELHNLTRISAAVREDLHDIENQYLLDGEMLVGTIDSRIVAMGALKKRMDSMAEIKRMRVHPDYQGRGYGQAILSALEKRAEELDFTALQLDTTTRQAPAQRLYEKNGYREVGRGRVGDFEVIFYEKRLAGRTA